MCNVQELLKINQAIFEYIEVFYNRQRLHSTNDYISPVNYELKMLEYQTAAEYLGELV